MDCREFEKQWQETDDPSGFSTAMEEHQRSCRVCSDVVEDVSNITRLARQMVAYEQPSDRVWQGIRRQLEQGGLIREPRRRWSPVPSFGWVPGLAYAGVFFAALGVVYLHSVMTRGVAPLPLAPQAQAAASANAGSPQRDAALKQLFGKIAPAKRAAYEASLDRVNSSIHELQTFVETHPEDPFGQSQLLNAYQQKERLWETAVRWEEF
jgi:hypothetical protein